MLALAQQYNLYGHAKRGFRVIGSDLSEVTIKIDHL
jgi:hypothetical protein